VIKKFLRDGNTGKLLVQHPLQKRLVEKETMEREEFEQILVANGVTPKKKEDILVTPQVVNF